MQYFKENMDTLLIKKINIPPCLPMAELVLKKAFYLSPFSSFFQLNNLTLHNNGHKNAIVVIKWSKEPHGVSSTFTLLLNYSSCLRAQLGATAKNVKSQKSI
jgi:hypothetical protein